MLSTRHSSNMSALTYLATYFPHSLGQSEVTDYGYRLI